MKWYTHTYLLEFSSPIQVPLSAMENEQNNQKYLCLYLYMEKESSSTANE